MPGKEALNREKIEENSDYSVILELDIWFVGYKHTLFLPLVMFDVGIDVANFKESHFKNSGGENILL